MLLQLIRVVLGGREGQARGNDTLDTVLGQLSPNAWNSCSRGIVRQIQEEGDPLHATILLEISREEAACLHVDAHRGKDDGEILLVPVMDVFRRLVDETRLATDLGSDLVVRQTSSRENGDFLPTSNRVHGIDGGYTGRNHLFGVDL